MVSGQMGALNTAGKVTLLSNDSPFLEYTDTSGLAQAIEGRGECHAPQNIFNKATHTLISERQIVLIKPVVKTIHLLSRTLTFGGLFWDVFLCL